VTAKTALIHMHRAVKRLCSTFCTNEASRGLFATADLLQFVIARQHSNGNDSNTGQNSATQAHRQKGGGVVTHRK